MDFFVTSFFFSRVWCFNCPPVTSTSRIRTSCHYLVSEDVDGVLRTVLGDDGVTPKNRVWLRKWFETIKAEVEAALDKAADRAARADGPSINYDALKPSSSDDPG